VLTIVNRLVGERGCLEEGLLRTFEQAVKTLDCAVWLIGQISF